MNTGYTLDVKRLGHAERENIIFSSLEKLEQGQTMRLILEFNPVPLVYLLKAGNDFDVAYEKEGPDEWILSVKKIAER
ncbi:MAG: DUF2249 domain-containing protein, partial [Acidobacteriota bacterium]